jgi:hypothetical protein
MKQESHPHSKGNDPGSYADHLERPDVKHGRIGAPFTPHMHTAPILGMAVMPKTVVQCGCGQWVHYDGEAESFRAQCCGATLHKVSLPVPVPCSCHN